MYCPPVVPERTFGVRTIGPWTVQGSLRPRYCAESVVRQTAASEPRLWARPHSYRYSANPRTALRLRTPMSRTQYVEFWAENWNERFRINRPLFAPRLDLADHGAAGDRSEAILVIRIDRVTFPAKHTAEGKPNAASGQIKQVRSVNVHIQCRELHRKQVPRTCDRILDEREIGREHDMLGIDKRVIRHRLSDEYARGGIKYRVGRVHNLLEPRSTDELGLRNILDLAVHERSIVATGPVKQLFAFYAHRETLGYVFVVDQAVAKIENARTSAARDDLLKWIERVERGRAHPNFRRGRAAKRRDSTRERRIGRHEDRRGTRRLETARG